MSDRDDERDEVEGEVELEPDDHTELVELTDEPGVHMTRKMFDFCQHYLRHGHGTRAAREAGYKGSEKVLGIMAVKLRRNPKVATYLAKRQKVVVTEAMVIHQLWQEATTAEHAGARVRADELLGKTHGMFTERLDISMDPKAKSMSDERLCELAARGDPVLKAYLMARLRGEAAPAGQPGDDIGELQEQD